MTYRDYGDMRPMRSEIAAALRVARLFRGWPKAAREGARKRTNELRRERNAAP